MLSRKNNKNKAGFQKKVHRLLTELSPPSKIMQTFPVLQVTAKILPSISKHTSPFWKQVSDDRQYTTIVPEPSHELIVNVFKTGMRYIFKRELSNAARKAELGAQLDHGNHYLSKFSASNANEVTRLFVIDVTHGFSFLFPMWIVPLVKKKPWYSHADWRNNIPSTTRDIDSKKIVSPRTSLSLLRTSVDASVNSQIDMDAYPDMIYGFCQTRMSHYILSLRLCHSRYCL